MNSDSSINILRITNALFFNIAYQFFCLAFFKLWIDFVFSLTWMDFAQNYHSHIFINFLSLFIFTLKISKLVKFSVTHHEGDIKFPRSHEKYSKIHFLFLEATPTSDRLHTFLQSSKLFFFFFFRFFTSRYVMWKFFTSLWAKFLRIFLIKISESTQTNA